MSNAPGTMSTGTTSASFELTLVDIAHNVEKDIAFDPTILKNHSSLYTSSSSIRDEDIKEIVEGVFDSSQTAPRNDPGSTERLTKSVLRFMRLPDKYTALTSTLLKSRSFHQTYKTEPDEESAGVVRPVVELPRTKHGKPYIPLSSASFSPSSVSKENDGECEPYPMSVSHQFPHVGLARLLVTHERAVWFPGGPSIKIGLDVVTFDPPNAKLYPTTDAFLEVFRESFTQFEWDRIFFQTDVEASKSKKPRKGVRSFLGGRSRPSTNAQSPRTDEAKLREFYLRWAMKESYTKALGVGMGLEFNSFQTCLEGVDRGLMLENDGEDGLKGTHVDGEVFLRKMDDGGIWGATLEHRVGQGRKQKVRMVRGSLTKPLDKVDSSADGLPEEYWGFWFLPLPLTTNDGNEVDISHTDTTEEGSLNGCACVCVGPLLSPGVHSLGDASRDGSRNAETVESVGEPLVRQMTLEDLILYHRGDVKNV